MYNGSYELIYINGSRRKVLVASVMEMQVMCVKARGVRYICMNDRTKRFKFGSKI